MALIGDRIREARIAQKVSQVDLAKSSGVPQSAISNIENNKREPGATTVEKLAQALGVDVSTFFGKNELSQDENIFLVRYRSLNYRQRSIIDNILDEFTTCSQVSGLAAAGRPIFSPSTEINHIIVPARYANNRFFVVQAKGNSMVPRINDGDYVVVQKDTPADPGQLALVRVDDIGGDEYAIKLVVPHGNKIELRSINPQVKPMIYSRDDIHSVEKIVDIISAQK